MNKITIKKIPFKLQGELIKDGQGLEFKLKNQKGKEEVIKPTNGLTVISTFPKLNTRVCDMQTQWLSKTASNNPNINFVSITVDNQKVITEWCSAHGIDNLSIYSDYELDFGNKTNAYIPKAKKLARGFMIFKDSELVEVSFKKELSDDPDYALVEKYIKN